MNKKEINQVQCGDYFMFKGEIVKIRSLYIGKKSKNDYSVFVETKNGRRFYVNIEELQPITINRYTLESAGITPTDDNIFFYVEGVRVKYGRMGVVDSISHDESGACLNMAITDFHVLQNALRLFGVEVELK